MPNTAPSIANLNGDSVQYVEDGPVVRLDANLNAQVSDADSADFDGGTLTVTYNRQTGDTLGFSGTATPGTGQTVVVGGTTIGTYAQITGGGLQFTFNSAATPARVQEVIRSLTFQTTSNTPAEGTRTFTYTLTDGDGTAGGGADAVSVASTINVVATNDPPEGQDFTVTIAEDGVFNFGNHIFGYTDPDATGVDGIIITTLPTNGTLYLGNAPVTAGQFIPNEQRNFTEFKPDPEESGTPYATFTFQWRDIGGAVDPTPNVATINVFNVYDVPRLQNFGGSNDPVLITEGLGGFSIDPGLDALVVDPDSPMMTNGQLRLVPKGNLGLGYNFDINPGGGITVTSQAVGGEVQYNGVTFGTILADNHGWNINDGGHFLIGFNSNATPEAVSALIRRATLSIDSGNSGTYEFLADLKDGSPSTGTYQQPANGGFQTSFFVNFTATNDAPVILDLTPSRNMTVGEAGSPQLIDTNGVQVTDEEGNYAGSQLRVSGFGGDEYVLVRHEGTGAGQVGVSGSTITYGGAAVATFSGGVGTDLQITFTTANPTAISRVIGNLYFQAPAASDSTRVLLYTYTDSAGAQFTQEVVLTVGAGSQPTTGDDFLYGTSGNDYIDARAGNDTVRGLAGDDILIGGAGVDTMDGGAGSDTYYVDNAADVVIDPVAEGVDRVATTVSYNLPGAADIEIFEVANSTSADNLTLGGNNFGQTIVGNAGNNVINGGGGDDVLVGLAGNDTLIGSPGNDVMHGGTGDDVYFVDAAGDQVFENSGEGTDRIATSTSYVLAAGASVETLETAQLSATTALNLTGNAFTQYVIGNDGNNVLQSGGGNDWLIGAGGNDTIIGSSSASTMEGGLGNDVYFVADSSDFIFELAGGGSDRVAASTSYTLAANAEVETLEATNLGSTNALNFTGNVFQNTIIGNNGANILDGKGGADVLIGAGGADTFAFTSALGSGNVDRIDGFVSGSDRIALDDAVFTAIAPGALQAGAFVTGAAAQDADDRIIYNQATGALFYDPDGTGAAAAVQFATLSGAPALTGSDFILV